MSISLLNAMLKAHGKNMANYAIGAVLYEWLVIWIFPSIAKNSSLNDVLQNMPASLLKAMGMEGGIQQLSDYLASEFYGLLFVLILMIYAIMTAVQLIVRLVDQGSMAYLLSTPVSRAKTAFTQAVVLVIGLFSIAAATTVGGLIGVPLLIDDQPAFDQGLFIEINLVGFLLFAVIGGYSFLFSCMMNDEKRALGAAAGLTVLFYALDMISKLSDKFDWAKNVTIFHLFRPQEIAHGTFDVWPTSIGLALAAVVLFGAGIVLFKKRDLPL